MRKKADHFDRTTLFNSEPIEILITKVLSFSCVHQYHSNIDRVLLITEMNSFNKPSLSKPFLILFFLFSNANWWKPMPQRKSRANLVLC